MDLQTVFRKALDNPLEVSEAEFQRLLFKFPYSQPIIFAHERKKALEGGEVDKQKTLMYAYNSFWLRDYLQKPISEIPELATESDDYVPFIEVEALDSGEVEEEVEVVEDFVEDDLVIEEEPIEEPVPMEAENPIMDDAEVDVEEEELEEDLFDPPVAYNIESVFPEEENKAEIVETSLEMEASHREEDVSLYNDDLMPYSFRWWLYKTRLEHADTYQPFVSPVLPKPQNGQFDPKKLDEAILDQQIRENIFHLQNPEDKLSEQFKKETIEFRSNEPNDEVIEKFIREEPQIQPPKAETINTENKARSSSEDQFSVVTETLANIYESQGMYEKAISVFKKLISENPEKKSYFATRIKELEQKL
ncbi:tetratricopeptide repeat protein [Sphingobacterium lactis]|uniref:tetratricopeptide repeat protein n=1 Tax=Sphingobacterium lactis TaxID=797291 RepID=UPI003F7D6303